ncbi:regulator of G protein signaling-like domain-containing protein [Ditylenchus destructor]|uniref:Regulator of G protein signaling-like domain-containing protein n=1 Tax=Ditylenchus destructor TaxID=166010 RepID=A0AAD4MZA6_9BILA|nr:regulator of G protein signaling-like domain-containing protein [Ditylenchus destructor]
MVKSGDPRAVLQPQSCNNDIHWYTISFDHMFFERKIQISASWILSFLPDHRLYQSFPNTKELRRFAYEIFSTFLIPTAPLHVPDISQPLIQQIDKVLRSTAKNSTSQEIASG